MKTKCIFLMTLCAFVCMLGYSRTNIPLSTEIPVGGGGARSPFPPPTAYLDEDEVQVLLSVAAPLTITICGQSGNCLFSKEYASTQEVTIPLSENDITEGEYILRVFSMGLCWKGNFTVEASKPAPVTSGDGTITLLNDNSETPNYDDLHAYVATAIDYLWICFSGGPGRMPVTIVGEDKKTYFNKELIGVQCHDIGLNYLGMPNGKYTLSIFWLGCWWRGDFEFKSHKPEGEYVYVDSTYYRLNKGTAVTVEPDINGRTRSMRMYWTAFERDYPLHVVIPSDLSYKGKSYTVTGIEKGSFQYCHFLLSASLPNTVTSIGQCAFAECDNLVSFDIPESVTSLADGVFQGCEKLTSIVVPEGITAIKYATFKSCTRLASISLPSNLTSIGGWAFRCCTNLPLIDIPDGVTSIGEYAFADCPTLTEIKLPKELKQVEKYAFLRCSSLASIEIPDGVTFIGDEAFAGTPDDAHIYCYAKGPFAICENTFNFNGTLHVPYGCKERFEKAAKWSRFAHIEEMAEEEEGPEANSGETGVTPATLSEESARYYDLQGRPVDGTQKGILIRNGKKVLVR